MSRCLLAALVVAGLASRSSASDLIFGLAVNNMYDDNVYGLSSGERDDFTIQVVPKVRYADRFGSFGVDLRYEPNYEYFATESGLRGWNHSAQGELTWHPSPTTSVTFDDGWLRYRNTRLLTTASSSGTPVERGSRDPFTRNFAQLNLQHTLDAAQRITVSAYHMLWDFEEAGRVDQQNVGGELEYLHLIRKDLWLGGNVSVSHALFDTESGSSDTTYYSTSLTLLWDVTDRLSMKLSAGPAYIDGNQEQPKVPPGAVLLAPMPKIEADTSVTAFADTSLTWRFENGRLSLGYQRRDDFGSALGFSAVTDSVTATASYEFRRDLSVDLSLVWEGRLSHMQSVVFQPIVFNFVFPVLVEGDQHLDSVSATLTGSYLITENTKLNAWTSWRTQNVKSEVPTVFGDLERFQVYLGVTHQFAAIRW